MKLRKLFNRKKRTRRVLRANHFLLESLESRLLLSASPVALNDVYTVQHDSNLTIDAALVGLLPMIQT